MWNIIKRRSSETGMDFKQLFEKLLPQNELKAFQDLEGWRVYYIRVILIIGLIGLTVGTAFSTPVFLAQGKKELIAFDIAVIAVIIATMRLRHSSFAVKIFFTLLYGTMLTFIISMGPLYARPGWLVMIVVSAAFLFGVRAAVITTAINFMLLTGLYWLAGPYLEAWMPVYQEPAKTWIMFSVNISLLSLYAGLPVGFLLERMNGLLYHERDLRSQLELERETLESVNAILRTEIAERRKTEEEKTRLQGELNQAQKMEALGNMAGGIAHDFNNILSAIIGNSQLVLNDPSISEKIRQKIIDILNSSARAKGLVRQILTFSRKAEVHMTPLKLSESVKDALQMMRSLIPAGIKVEERYDAAGLILSSPTYIHQIIMNLCSNAVQAMDKENGILKVCLTREFIDEDKTVDGVHLPKGVYLKITFSDNGSGIPTEVIGRIFEPYFTTRETGQGTGLGLAVVHGIVQSHGGAIACRSTPHMGTSFDIYFPEVEERRKAEMPREEKEMPMGTEKILFVDDEAMLCEIAAEMLGDLGYQVVCKTSSVEAYEIFTDDPQRFDAVITDMSMPQMSGDKLAQKILDLRPDMPIIMCTGYSAHISKNEAVKRGIREFLMKPYDMDQMAYALRRVIDRRPAAFP